MSSMADLTDEERPWRHDPKKLAQALLVLYTRRDSNARRPVEQARADSKRAGHKV